MFKGPSPKHCQVISLFCTRGYCDLDLCHYCLFDLGLTSLSTIFQSYRDSIWMWQGAQCSLLECCLTEISHPRTFAIRVIYWSRPNIPSKFKGSSLKHCQIISFLVLKVMVTLTMTFAHSVIYRWGPTSLLSLRVLAPSNAKLSSFLILKVLVTVTFALRINYWWRPTSLLFEGPNRKYCRIISCFWYKRSWWPWPLT